MQRATPVHVIGDSHSLIYADRVLEQATSPVVFRTLYCPSLRARELVDGAGELDARVRAHMLSARLLVEAGAGLEAFHRTRDQVWRAAAVAEDRYREQPTLILACGSLDALFTVADLPAQDVALPDDVRAHFDVAACCTQGAPDGLEAAQARALFRTTLTGFGAGLARLRELGFHRLIVLSVPPPTSDDEQFRAMTNSVSLPLSERRLATGFRYKIALLVNDTLRRLCGEHGVTFLNRWNAQTTGGLARPRLLHDAIHISSYAAGLTLDMVRPLVEPRLSLDAFYAASREAAGPAGGRTASVQTVRSA